MAYASDIFCKAQNAHYGTPLYRMILFDRRNGA